MELQKLNPAFLRSPFSRCVHVRASGTSAQTLPGIANYFMPDGEAEMPPHTSDVFFIPLNCSS